LLDRRLVESAALLHDLDKLSSVKSEVDGLPHAEGSADWLARHGFPELGPVVVGHPVTRLADAAWFDLWLETAPPEALILAYADKRAGQRLESMTARFGSWERRYPPADRAGRARGSWTSETLLAVWHRAETLELRVCELAGVAPDEVRRLAWTGRALRSARSG
jgi:HD superfamily phosphodiesterase